MVQIHVHRPTLLLHARRALPAAPLAIIGTAVSFYLGFKGNAAYGRLVPAFAEMGRSPYLAIPLSTLLGWAFLIWNAASGEDDRHDAYVSTGAKRPGPVRQ